MTAENELHTAEDILGADADELQEAGNQRALELFHRAADHLPAYRRFLADQEFSPRHVETYGDFLQVPVTTKANYIERYSPEERSWPEGTAPPVYRMGTSSGTSGKRNY